MPALLEVHDLQAGYGSIRALKGVSFRLEEGQVVTLIGANGAGKSTTLNTISGLLKPTKGRVIFQGQDITGWRADRITRLGLVQVPEGRQIIANMSVMENLTIGAPIGAGRAGGQSSDLYDMEGIFARFPRLNERRTQKAGLLSGGEQQMLAIGRALLMRPALLMLDEPSMGLAPLLVNEVFALVAEIKASGIPFLLVEQNARKALHIADTAYVLERGQIVQSGSAAELQRDESVIAAYLG